MRVRIRRRYWQLVMVPKGDVPLGRDGKSHLVAKFEAGCCENPSFESKRIMVREGQAPEKELDTHIHEFTHAAFWDLAEEAVDEYATDLARYLTRLGYVKDTSGRRHETEDTSHKAGQSAPQGSREQEQEHAEDRMASPGRLVNQGVSNAGRSRSK